MSKFYKKITKYSQTYVKRIEKKQLGEEAELVFKIIGLMSVNSLIVFTSSLLELETKYTGINSKVWYTKLKMIDENMIHNILFSITAEYLEDSSNHAKTLLAFPNIEHWKGIFYMHFNMKTENHLVDIVFPNLFLADANRNEVPVLTFVQTMGKLFERLDVAIQNALEKNKEKV